MKRMNAKPCPFCGWEVIEGIVDLKKGYRIRCKSCKCGTDWHKYWKDAVKAWNRRPGEPDE